MRSKGTKSQRCNYDMYDNESEMFYIFMNL